MKVYLIYCDDGYDGYDKVVAVFTKKHLAKKALLLCPDSTPFNHYYYEEQETDISLNAPENCRPYEVLVREDTVVQVKVLRFLENSDLYASMMGSLLAHMDTTPPEQQVYCWATDADHASQLALKMTHADLKVPSLPPETPQETQARKNKKKLR